MAEISFDLQKYIDQRKGNDEALAQSGAAYAYPGDQKVLRTLARVTPVTLAVEATVRLWKSRAGRDLLGSAVKVTEKQQPELYRNACLCAERLGTVLPALYVAPVIDGRLAYTFGSNQDASMVLSSALVEKLSAEELRFVIGHECGQVQMGHVVYMTALYYLTTSASQYVRWVVKPAVMALSSWARRAEVSNDRAGLICSGDLAASTAALCRLELGTVSLPAEPADLERQSPRVRVRLAALRLFSETHYFLKASGLKPREQDGKSLAWCDERSKQALSRGEDKSKAGE